MSRRWETESAKASQPQATISAPTEQEAMPTAFGRLLVIIYARCTHKKHPMKRLKVALKMLREEHLDLPSTFDLTTWTDEGMGYTVLHWAAYYSQYEMIKVLARAGCNVNATDCGQETPLFIACGKGDLLMVEGLVDLGAYINVMSEQTESPLLVAAREGNPDVVRYLLRQGPIKQSDYLYYSRAGMAGNVEAIEALLSGVPVQAGLGQKGASTVLEAMCRYGDAKVVRALLSGGLRWATDDEKKNAIMFAIMQEDLGVVLALLEAGCMPSDGQLGILLWQAIMSNNLSIFDALLSNRELPASEMTQLWKDPKHPLGETLLHVACREASTKFVASMVEHYGWDKNVLDKQKQTPLQYALRGHCFDTRTLPYLVMVARVGFKGLSSEHVHALMKRVARVMAKPRWKEFLKWRHEYLVERSHAKFAERREKAMQHSSLQDSSIPRCPLSKVRMTEAIVAADGFVYQKKAIKKWIKEAIESDRPCYSPVTGQVMSTILLPNPRIRALAKKCKV